MVANVPGDPHELYEEVYCQRGEMENRIKEQQLELFADRTSCHRFLANQFRLLLSSAAYVLVQAMRRTALAGTELAQGAGGDDPAEVVQGGGAGGGDGAAGGVPPGEQLPVPELFRRRYERVMGRPPLPAAGGLSGPKIAVGARLPRWGSGGGSRRGAEERPELAPKPSKDYLFVVRPRGG